MRKPFQGVLNIIRFNWHYFAFSIGFILILLFISGYLDSSLKLLIIFLGTIAFLSIMISLLVSYYIYDVSNLYKLDWIKINNPDETYKIVNINAGFDETSELLQKKFANSDLIAFDFYNSEKHTEVSIKRARKAYPPFPATQQISTNKIPLNDNTVDFVFLILSAHEIRDSLERTLFFTELNRIIKPVGKIYLTEHLQDLPNFLAYNIGAFHFHKREDWLENIENSDLKLLDEFNITSFIKTFVLEKHGNSS